MIAFLLLASGLTCGAVSLGGVLAALAAIAIASRIRAQAFADVLLIRADRQMRNSGDAARAAVLLLAAALLAGVVA